MGTSWLRDTLQKIEENGQSRPPSLDRTGRQLMLLINSLLETSPEEMQELLANPTLIDLLNDLCGERKLELVYENDRIVRVQPSQEMPCKEN